MSNTGKHEIKITFSHEDDGYLEGMFDGWRYTIERNGFRQNTGPFDTLNESVNSCLKDVLEMWGTE